MTSSTHPAQPGMMEAKFNISKLLDIPINSRRALQGAHLGLLTCLSGAGRGGRPAPGRAAGARARASSSEGGGPAARRPPSCVLGRRIGLRPRASRPCIVMRSCLCTLPCASHTRMRHSFVALERRTHAPRIQAGPRAGARRSCSPSPAWSPVAAASSSSASSSASPSADTSQGVQDRHHPDRHAPGARRRRRRASRTRSPRRASPTSPTTCRTPQGDMATTASIAQKFAGDSLDLDPRRRHADDPGRGQGRSPTTPIVFTAVTDPVGAGLVHRPQRARPATSPASATCSRSSRSSSSSRPSVPDAKTVGIVYNAGESNSVFLVKQAEKDAASHGPHDRQGARPAPRPRSRPRRSRWSAASTPSP